MVMEMSRDDSRLAEVNWMGSFAIQSYDSENT